MSKKKKPKKPRVLILTASNPPAKRGLSGGPWFF